MPGVYSGERRGLPSANTGVVTVARAFGPLPDFVWVPAWPGASERSAISLGRAAPPSCIRPARSIPTGTLCSVVVVIRPVFSVAGRIRPATTSSEPARATSHPKDRSVRGGGAERLDSAGAEATLAPDLFTRFPEDPLSELSIVAEFAVSYDHRDFANRGGFASDSTGTSLRDGAGAGRSPFSERVR